MARTKASQRPFFPLLGEPLALDLINTVVRRAGDRVGGTELVDLISQPHRWGEWLDYQRARLQPLLGGELTEHMRSADCLERIRELRDAARVVVNAARIAPIAHVGSTAAQNARSAPTAPMPSAESSVRPFPEAATTTLGLLGGDVQVARLDIEALSGALTTATIELASSAEVATIRECQAPGCGLLFVPRHPARRWCSSWTCGNRTRAARHSALSAAR